ncbi:MAG: hypothetical protein KGS61_00360 [Verrucomicrobia bacterium]|nr:hypothetical protein [Verrucomicrobiota bacterium]
MNKTGQVRRGVCGRRNPAWENRCGGCGHHLYLRCPGCDASALRTAWHCANCGRVLRLSLAQRLRLTWVFGQRAGVALSIGITAGVMLLVWLVLHWLIP